jgi:predicted MFS family arabinose efflux permease
VLGGVFADWLSWRAGFFINVPIGIGLILATRCYIVETERHAGRFYVAGALTSTFGMSALVFGIVHSTAHGWNDPTTDFSLTASVVLLGTFIFAEWRAKQPIMPLRLFHSAERCGAYIARMLFVGATVGFFFFLTQFMQEAIGFTPTEAGLAFLPAMLANFAAAIIGPKTITRFGAGTVLAASVAVSIVGALWLAECSATTTYLSGLALPMLLPGIGQGGAMGPLTAYGLVGVARHDAGAASGLVNAAHQLGASLGLGLLVAIAASGSDTKNGTILIQRVDHAMTGAAVMFLVALVVIAALIIRRSIGRAAALEE